jgi:kynureninase
MEFDHRKFRQPERVENSDRSVRVTGRVDDDASGRTPGALDHRYQFALEIRLSEVYRDTERVGPFVTHRLDIRERLMAINMRLPHAQHVQVRAVYDHDFWLVGHVRASLLISQIGYITRPSPRNEGGVFRQFRAGFRPWFTEPGRRPVRIVMAPAPVRGFRGLPIPYRHIVIWLKEHHTRGAPMVSITKLYCQKLDAEDPLAGLKDRFMLPDGMVYLDGNSLGPVPKTVPDRVASMISQEWGERLISGWLADGWMEKPLVLGDRVARLIGAAPGEVAVVDTTSINLFKLLASALRLRSDRKVILSNRENFPTDLYMAQGLSDWLGQGHELRLVAEDEIASAIDEDVAVVMLTQTNFKTGRVLDMKSITAAAHGVGALTIWDLAHSAGAFAVDLNGAAADFAVGCSYKYLNAGPGGPAFLFVAQRHQEKAEQPLTGWLGHESPFAFDIEYRPAMGIRRHICSSPGVLGLVAFEAALDVFDLVDMKQLRMKSNALCDLFITLVEERCGGVGFELITPRGAGLSEPFIRGSQVSFSHPDGYAIVQALIRRGVIGDFRDPDVMRFGFTPLYIGYCDVFDAVEHLRMVMEWREWDDSAFKARASVT